MSRRASLRRPFYGAGRAWSTMTQGEPPDAYADSRKLRTPMSGNFGPRGVPSFGSATTRAMMSWKAREPERRCSICGKLFAAGHLTPGAVVRPEVAAEIGRAHPDWSADKFICRADLATFRARYGHSLLESERGELTSLERDVLHSLRQHEMLSSDVDAQFERAWTVGERLADKITAFGGSWTFLIVFALFLSGWIVMNTLVLVWRPVDAYPFILLNLVLSCLAAVQAPIIMMSQNRQDAEDRLRAQHDCQVNLKAEPEIRQLHERLDHLLSHQWERLAEIQEVQVELLSELGKGK